MNFKVTSSNTLCERSIININPLIKFFHFLPMKLTTTITPRNAPPMLKLTMRLVLKAVSCSRVKEKNSSFLSLIVEDAITSFYDV